MTIANIKRAASKRGSPFDVYRQVCYAFNASDIFAIADAVSTPAAS